MISEPTGFRVEAWIGANLNAARRNRCRLQANPVQRESGARVIRALRLIDTFLGDFGDELEVALSRLPPRGPNRTPTYREECPHGVCRWSGTPAGRAKDA